MHRNIQVFHSPGYAITHTQSCAVGKPLTPDGQILGSVFLHHVRVAEKRFECIPLQLLLVKVVPPPAEDGPWGNGCRNQRLKKEERNCHHAGFDHWVTVLIRYDGNASYDHQHKAFRRAEHAEILGRIFHNILLILTPRFFQKTLWYRKHHFRNVF